jgi:low temperature requirement protein LtrA
MALNVIPDYEPDTVTMFINYTNQQIFNYNLNFLEAIQMYLLDNNIPQHFKQINYIYNSVQNIANQFQTELNIFHNNNNNNNGQIFNDRITRTLLLINDVFNLLNQVHQPQV